MTSTESSPKKRRIMIITADESLIDQIQKNGTGSILKSFVLDSNDDDVEISHSKVTTPPSTSNAKKAKTSSLTCVVCGSIAYGYNFDAITCESCKAFFRRNAMKDPETMDCRRHGSCDVTTESRRRCSACRLSKCLRCGMRRDRLLTVDQKVARRRKIEENRSLTLQKIEEQKSDEKGTVLTSVVCNQSSIPEDRNLLLLNNVTELLPSTSATTDDVLSSEDLQRVATVQLSYEQRIELARDGLPWNPSAHVHTFLQQINARSVPVMRLLSFFKQIPEFNELNVGDRVTLVKYNLIPLVILNHALCYNQETGECVESDSDAPVDSAAAMISIHGRDLYLQVRKIFHSFVRIAQYDQRIVQLALIVLILTKGFSTSASGSEPILNDELAVNRAQNHYSELLWRYLETTHGRTKAIQTFNELVAHFISWQTLQGQLQNRIQTQLTPTEIDDLLPIMRSLLHIP